MLVRAFCVLALCLTPVAVRAADEDNPYKSARVGDFASYKLTTKIGTLSIDGTLVQTVTDKSDKEATIHLVGSASLAGDKKDVERTQKVDLTKPFDPTKSGIIPGGGDTKVEKLKEGKEKIKVGGKEYDATWTTYKTKAKALGADVDGDMKVWVAKGVPSGLVKMSIRAKLAGQDMDVLLELTESGNKKK
ncbi:MAG TPA: hypothetical protein VGE74_26480 [Gemmata sp.]